METQLPLRILEAVRLLHRLGYRGLRILPGLNASGTAWRIVIFNVTEWNADDEFGAAFEASESCLYSTAADNIFNDSVQFPVDVSHVEVAEAVLEAMPSLQRRSLAETGNSDYVGWYAQLMSQVHQLSDLPVAYADWYDPPDGWELGTDMNCERLFPKPPHYTPDVPSSDSRGGSDEHYVLGLCEEVAGAPCVKQKTFDWLVGLPSKKTGSRRPLPVDGYWEKLRLVVEYHEKQHSEPVPFFDNKVTASGLLRGEQRKIHDQRKADLIPAQGLSLLVIDYRAFEHRKGKIVRVPNQDRLVIGKMIEDVLR
ncbi:hypothetical protein ADIAG_02466 [Paeniglutamicibacter gangotriensis Lz1y]|uniref:Uncharacterized protein n=1 Tax=Paeniglutamicibacter gangotriensis Lz1y TaxID=1276920 RepID=M7MU35_9MICC|nr:hypothetical protein ADIAG_02466 [Paeniglutamicibacter gangotriensis Lz1y]